MQNYILEHCSGYGPHTFVHTTHFPNVPKTGCHRLCPLPVSHKENGKECHTNHKVPDRRRPHAISDEVPETQPVCHQSALLLKVLISFTLAPRSRKSGSVAESHVWVVCRMSNHCCCCICLSYRFGAI